jgi:glycosyltransferase involved in cell wall biosynthesis
LLGKWPMDICFHNNGSHISDNHKTQMTSMEDDVTVRRITIGIPSYNERQNIVNLLRAVEEQHIPIFEVLISDDSSDDTPKLVRNFAQHSSLNIQIFHHDARRGAAAAWNEILQKAEGDVIVLYDADTIPHPSCAEQLTSKIKENVGICASNSQPVQAAGIAGRASVFISNWLRSVRLARLSQYTVMGRAVAINSDEAKKIEIPIDMIAIDLYIQCKILEMGRDVIYDDSALVYFKPANDMQDLASQVIRAINGHYQINEYASSFGIRLPQQIAIAHALKNAFKDPLGAMSVAIGYSLIPYYRSRLEDTDTAKWHAAASSKAIDYQQLKTRF